VGEACTRGPIPGAEAAVYGFGFCRTLLLTLWNIEGLASSDIPKLPHWTRLNEVIDEATRGASTVLVTEHSYGDSWCFYS
jgi:hypothetical protein